MPVLKNARWEIYAQNVANGMEIQQAYIAAGFKPNPGKPSTLKGTSRSAKAN
jgi:hypothetical protein